MVQVYRLKQLDMVNKNKHMTQYKLGELVHFL